MFKLLKILVVAIATLIGGYFFANPYWFEYYNDEKGALRFTDRGQAWIWSKPEPTPDLRSVSVNVLLTHRNKRLAQVIIPAAILWFVISQVERRRGKSERLSVSG